MGMTTIKVIDPDDRARRARDRPRLRGALMDLLWVRHGEPERIAPGTGVPADPAPHRARARAGATPRRLARARADRRGARRARSAARSRPQRRSPPRSGSRSRSSTGSSSTTRNSDHYIPMEELRRNKDERWTAMVEGRWEDVRRRPPRRVPRARRRNGRRDRRALRGPARRRGVPRRRDQRRARIVLGVEQPLWFEPGYTSLSRMLASRSGIRSVASLNELAHLTARRERVAAGVSGT